MKAAVTLALLLSAWILFGGPSTRRLSFQHLALSPNQDLQQQAELLASAAESQGLGWQACREAWRLDGSDFQRFPIFQFYAFLPFHAPAFLLKLGLDPYPALLLAFYASFVAAFLGAWRLARSLGLGGAAALLCGAAYDASPYHVTDLFGRFAYSELVCFALVPWTFFAARLCAQRPSLGRWLLCSLAFCALILSHNIFHAWTLFLLSLWLGAEALQGGLRWRSLLAPFSAYLLALALGAFFFALPLTLGPHLAISSVHAGSAYPPVVADLTPLRILFHPGFAQLPMVGASSPHLGLQLGWILLLPFLYLGIRRRFSLPWLGFALLLSLLLLPLDPWPYLGPLQIIQFSYRLLLYLSLLGALLAGESLERAGLQRAWPWLFLLVALSCLPWKRADPGLTGAEMRSQWQAQGSQSPWARHFLPDDAWVAQRYPQDAIAAEPAAQPIQSLNPTQWSLQGVKEGACVELPLPWYPGLYRLRVDGRAQAYGYHGKKLAFLAPPGAQRVECEFQGLPWANALSKGAALLWLALALLWFWKYKRRA